MEKVYVIDCLNNEIAGIISLEEWREFTGYTTDTVPWRKGGSIYPTNRYSLLDIPKGCFCWSLLDKKEVEHFNKLMIKWELHKEVLI
jgi:hypothetical protein